VSDQDADETVLKHAMVCVQIMTFAVALAILAIVSFSTGGF
jgi:hypothetical protein